MNLPAVAGRDGFYHISRGGPVYRLHQAGFIREIFQLFFQDDTFRQNAGKRFFRLFPQSVCNGSGRNGVDHRQQSGHDGSDEK